MKSLKYHPLFAAVAALCGLHSAAQAQLVIEDNLKGASSSFAWKALNGACLTAGNNTGTIPACNGLPYYANRTLVGGTTGRLPDAVGSGALRLTNGDTQAGTNGDNQTGAIVSDFTFPTDRGIEVKFTTVTYGGDNLLGTGADGISFFLSDGAKQPSVGALGGSLGYSCSNVNGQYDGVVGGYIGIGIDEFGNFSNPGDNTNTGPGFRAGRISLRGAGSTAFSELNRLRPDLYPSTLSATDRRTAVQNTCRNGVLFNYSGRQYVDQSGSTVSNYGRTSEPLPFLNYPHLVSRDYVGTVASPRIANQQAMNMPLRGNAVPITYGVKITRDGYLDFSYSVNGGTAQSVIKRRRITDSNGPLPTSFRFGFSSGTGGGSNVHEITCFKATEATESSSSAGANVRQSARVEAGTQVYLASYNPNNWSGQLTARSLVADSAGLLSINSVANWDASCVLTGGDCAATGVNGMAATPWSSGANARQILTWSPTNSRGTAFQWSSLDTAQRTSLEASAPVSNDDRLDYLRGDRSQEESSNGPFRVRASVLGDIIGSSPTWVGAPRAPYGASIPDKLYPSATGSESSYTTFKANNATRQNIVYVGANDGMLHGFRSGAYDAQGNWAPTATLPNDGREVLAYMPAAALSTIRTTDPDYDFSNPLYSHNFYVDATPGTGDVYYNNQWRTLLASGLGAGGNATGPVADANMTTNGAFFALDITNPANFAESNASTLALGEWNSSNLACANDTPSVRCRTSLGGVSGTPIMRRLHNGSWAALFGNGLNSESGKAGLFIMLMNPTTSAITFRFIETSVGASTTEKNGIAYVSSADLDGDYITDYVYAGDARGNLWRFDLTSSDPTLWSASAAPLFTTPAGQPITSRVLVASVPSGRAGNPRLMIGFGTGRQMPQTTTSSETYAAGTQALYGVWDWNFADWNSKPATAGDRYASLPGPRSIAITNLTTQTISDISAAPGTRTVSRDPICWAGSSVCESGNNKYGWKIDLPSSSEQIIYNPVLNSGLFVVNTIIPSNSSLLDCEKKLPEGYTMAVSLEGGAAPTESVFSDAAGQFTTHAGQVVSGVALGGTGSPSFVTTNAGNGATRTWIYTQTAAGNGAVNGFNPPTNNVGGRLNWIKLR
jgi:type IV pilus assembly protein PilY1